MCSQPLFHISSPPIVPTSLCPSSPSEVKVDRPLLGPLSITEYLWVLLMGMELTDREIEGEGRGILWLRVRTLC